MEKLSPYDVESISKAVIKFLSELARESKLNWELKSIKFGPNKAFALISIKIGHQLYYLSVKDEQ